MIFHAAYTPKAGFGPDDQKKILALWSKWQPPKGFEIKSFYVGVNGCGFLIVEADSTEAIYEAVGPWVNVYLDYEIVPVVPVDKAVSVLQKVIAFRDLG